MGLVLGWAYCLSVSIQTSRSCGTSSSIGRFWQAEISASTPTISWILRISIDPQSWWTMHYRRRYLTISDRRDLVLAPPRDQSHEWHQMKRPRVKASYEQASTNCLYLNTLCINITYFVRTASYTSLCGFNYELMYKHIFLIHSGET